MSRYRSNLVHALVALVLLTMSVLLWPSLGASSTHAAGCVANNSVCITNSPTAALTLNGTDQTVPYTLAFTLNNNLTGGWHVTITSTQFTKGGTPTHTLPTTASTVAGVAAVPTCNGSSCPNNQITYPIGVPAGTPAPTPVTFYNSAGTNHGVGTFTIQATINVLVPGNSYTGTYTSAMTLTLVTGGP